MSGATEDDPTSQLCAQVRDLAHRDPYAVAVIRKYVQEKLQIVRAAAAAKDAEARLTGDDPLIRMIERLRTEQPQSAIFMEGLFVATIAKTLQREPSA